MTDAPAPSRLFYKGSLIDGIDSVELLDAGIQTMSRGQSRFVAYKDIALVRLRYTPRRGMSELHVCTIEPRDGKPLRFGSLTHESFARGYVLVPYRAFVQALHARILAAGASPQFWAGDTSGQFALHLIGTIVAACVAVGIVITDKRLPGWGLIVVAIAFVLYGWPLVRTLRANETRRYSPRAIPGNLLPKDPP